MARLTYGRLSDAWAGEASDFTPLLADQLDVLGNEIGVELAAVGQTEVATTGGRRIDIVAEGSDGSEFVIENQYGRADHDHLARGLAYAVARRARGLVVVAEEHRDEFRAVAQYLNELAEHDPDRGIAVWLVESRAVRVGESPWAPLFSVVVEPNDFTASVEMARQSEAASRPQSIAEFLSLYTDPELRAAAQQVLEDWVARHKVRLMPTHAVLEAAGPAKSGVRTVVAVYPDGHVMVPFGSYAGQNSGIPVEPLTTPSFRAEADGLFGFSGEGKMATTEAGWLRPETASDLLRFCIKVACDYAEAVVGSTGVRT